MPLLIGLGRKPKCCSRSHTTIRNIEHKANDSNLNERFSVHSCSHQPNLRPQAISLTSERNTNNASISYPYNPDSKVEPPGNISNSFDEADTDITISFRCWLHQLHLSFLKKYMKFKQSIFESFHYNVNEPQTFWGILTIQIFILFDNLFIYSLVV